MHRVLPLKDSLIHLEKDNLDLEKNLTEKMLKIDEGMKLYQKNESILKKDLEKVIQIVQENYLKSQI